MKKTVLLISSIILGCIFGLLVGLSIKYPLKYNTVQTAADICKDHGGIEIMYIKVVGNIYSVTCNDGVYLIIKKKQLSQQQLNN